MATDTLDLTDVKFDLLVAEYEQHELTCTARHDEWVPVCSVDVTHMYTTCEREKFVCQHTADFVTELSKSARNLCEGCEVPVQKCWTVRPI